jgi:hypothetical protein
VAEDEKDESNMIRTALRLYLESMVDSSVPETRMFWRRKWFNATEQEAADPRPFAEVLDERLVSERK